MSEWGQKEYKSWPSRKPVAIYGALLMAFAVFAGVVYYQYEQKWTFLQRYYLPMSAGEKIGHRTPRERCFAAE